MLPSLTERGTIVLVTGPWNHPELTGIGRLPMHSVDHGERLPLDGRWRFQLLRTPYDEPGPDWAEADVPSLWTMAGTWDKPHYTNVQMPFAGLPPEIPDVNPTGIYEREFEVPADVGRPARRPPRRGRRERPAASASTATRSASARTRTSPPSST